MVKGNRERVMMHPEHEQVQRDERIRRWAPIAEMDGRYLRIVLLPDAETVHNAFFDRSFAREDSLLSRH